MWDHLLQQLVNNTNPGMVKKVNESKMAFKCMENINAFLEAARQLGVPAQETFQTVDLWERQNLNSVVICLQSLGRKACEQHQTRNGEERERIEDGVQMHGEHQRVPGSGAPARRTDAGNIQTVDLWERQNLNSVACEQHQTRNGEEGERIEDGVQMHGEHQRVPGSGAPARRTGAGNIPDGRTLGATEPELCGYLFAVAREKAEFGDGGFNLRLVNNIKPGMVKKVNESKMAFKCMENINAFLEAARQLGVPAQETFQTVELWERQNLNSVVICLQSLGRKVN
ncbi:unnamed protein product [Parnassius apollo]|uniref:(apollo) hypothetical protein n=1 Tax=Parnassius apollo TaxID=110799 RepID=A0A8S3WI59_PARAO|nr:unnamed protein product [Parnassius apollo]